MDADPAVAGRLHVFSGDPKALQAKMSNPTTKGR